MKRYILTVVAWSMLMSIAIGQTIIDYRGLEIQSPDPTGAAGLRLQNNFKALADRIGPANLTATAAPTVDDDVDEGYYAGSLWYDTVGGVLYWCADNTDGAATWKDLSTAGGAAAISDAAYAASWDGVTTIAPSKNTLYDYLSSLSTIYQAADADLTTYAGITPSANIQTFLGSADFATARTNLGVAIGTNVQAYDADLTTWAGVTSSANGRSLVSAADYAAMKTLLDLEIGTDVQAYSSTLASVANKQVDRLSQFVPYSGNPILEPEGTEAMAAFGSMWYESGTYHMYYMYWLSLANGAVGHATSPDGVTWTKDVANNPVFDRDDCAFSNFIRSATVWKEGSTWYLLYTGVRFGSSKDEVGLATSTNGVDFVQTGTEPILTYDDGTWDQYGVEITSLIKVGATYYAYYESPEVYETQRPRHIGIATSTDLTTWTKDVANNPVVGGFCPFVFVYDDDYYMICPDYTEGNDFTEFRLYRDSAPTFYEDSRVDLGPIYGTSASGADKIDLDTPCILTDTIERNSFGASNNELWMYYASYGGTWTQSLAKARFGHFPSVSANTSRGVGIGRFNRIIVDDESTTRTNLGLEIGVDVLAQQTIGIADNNLMEVDDADAASGQIARFTAAGLEGVSQNAGTDITADLEEETHAAEHAVSGADTVFPADPGADKVLKWDDDTGALVWADDTDTDTLGSIGSVANGDVLIYNSGWKRLGKGDDGQVLKLATGLPAWAADTDTNTTYTAGDGLKLTGTDFDLDLKTGGGLEIDTGQLRLSTAEAAATQAGSGATATLDFSANAIIKFTFDNNGGATTFTFTDPPAGSRCLLILIQDADGGETVTWPVAETIYWAGGTAFDPDTTAASRAVVTLVFDGTDYYCTGYDYATP